MFNKSNLKYQKMIIDKFVSEWVRGEDISFRDPNKINLLSKLSDLDIMSMINGTEGDDNLSKAMINR